MPLARGALSRACERAAPAAGLPSRPFARSISSSGAASRGKKQPASLAQSAVAMGIGYVVGVIGGAILAHAAYATIQCTLHPSSIPILLPSPRRRALTKFRRGSPFSEGAFDFPWVAVPWWVLGSSGSAALSDRARR